MSAQLSRRYGRVVSYPPLFGMPLEDVFALNHLTLERHTEFEDLPERYRQLILACVRANCPSLPQSV